jgi:hypothetical protein
VRQALCRGSHGFPPIVPPQGSVLLKYGRWGRPRYRLFRLSQDLQQLQWQGGRVGGLWARGGGQPGGACVVGPRVYDKRGYGVGMQMAMGVVGEQGGVLCVG